LLDLANKYIFLVNQSAISQEIFCYATVVKAFNLQLKWQLR